MGLELEALQSRARARATTMMTTKHMEVPTNSTRTTTMMTTKHTEVSTNSILTNNDKNEILTHKRFQITLFIRTKHNMQIFGVILFIKLQNDIKQLNGEKR